MFPVIIDHSDIMEIRDKYSVKYIDIYIYIYIRIYNIYIYIYIITHTSHRVLNDMRVSE